MAEKNKKKKPKKAGMKRRVAVLSIIAIAALTAAILTLTYMKKGKKVFTIGSEKVYMKEVSFYALQCAYTYHLTSADMLYEYYDGVTTYEEQYKNQVRQQIIDTKVMYLCALQQGITLSADDQGEIDTQTEETLSNIGEYLERFDIDETLVKRVLTEQYYASLLKQTLVVEEEMSSYFHTYNLLFPTVKMNADGTVKVNTDGSLVPESEADKNKQYELAMKACELAKSGNTIEEIAKELDVAATSGELYGDMEDYEFTAYLDEIRQMPEGTVSTVVETAYGYNVFYLYSKDDEEYAQSTAKQESLFSESELYETQLEKWYQLAEVDEEHLESDVWEQFSMKDYILK